jgi:hypothetical protein
MKLLKLENTIKLGHMFDSALKLIGYLCGLMWVIEPPS